MSDIQHSKAFKIVEDMGEWSASIDDEHAVVGAFIIDTATGETKTVYTRAIDANGKGAVFKNNLKKTFHSIQ
jgi:hypothetical protein